MRKVVIDDQHIAARFHKKLADAGRGVRSDEGKARRVIALGHDDDGIFHRTIFLQGCNGLGDGGSALADGAIDAQNILAALVEDRVDRNCGLPGLAVAEDQFALAAPNGYERVDDFEAGLQRHGDGRAVHDMRGGTLDGQELAGEHRPVAVERTAERVDDAPEQSIAHGHVHDPARALHFISRVEMRVFAEQNDANFIRVHVERNAEHVSGKRHQFIVANAGKPRHLGDAGGDAGDRAHLARRELRRECFPRLADFSKCGVENVFEGLRVAVHWLIVSGFGSSSSGSVLVSGVDSALATDLSFCFRSSSTFFSIDAR